MVGIKALEKVLASKGKDLTQEELKAAFKEAFKKGPKMFRSETEYSYKPLKDFAFKEELTSSFSGGMTSRGEPTGIYFAEHPLDIPSLKIGASKDREGAKRTYSRLKEIAGADTYPYNVTAAPLPGSRMKEFTAAEWEELGYKSKNFRDLTAELKKDYDFVKFPDIITRNEDLAQWVQLNPQKSIARLNTGDKLKDRLYKVLGLGAATVGAGTMMEDEAEASPIGELGKASAKILKKGISSASEKLAGMELKGKIIKEVRGGHGSDWRDVVFTDGTSLPMTKDYIHELVKHNQTKIRMADFPENPENKLQTALNSLKHTLQYHSPLTAADANRVPTGGLVGVQANKAKRMLGELGVDKDTHVMCRMLKDDAAKLMPGKMFSQKKYVFFTLRKDAAHYLEEMGVLEVIK